MCVCPPTVASAPNADGEAAPYCAAELSPRTDLSLSTRRNRANDTTSDSNRSFLAISTPPNSPRDAAPHGAAELLKFIDYLVCDVEAVKRTMRWLASTVNAKPQPKLVMQGKPLCGTSVLAGVFEDICGDAVVVNDELTYDLEARCWPEGVEADRWPADDTLPNILALTRSNLPERASQTVRCTPACCGETAVCCAHFKDLAAAVSAAPEGPRAALHASVRYLEGRM